MHRTQEPTTPIDSPESAPLRSLSLVTMLGLLAIIASACGTEATTATEERQSDLTTTTPAVQTHPAPDAEVIAFALAFGVGDADQAWNTVSERCQDTIPEADYQIIVADYAVQYPGNAASRIIAEVDGDMAAITYDIHNGSGEFLNTFIAQPWVFFDGSWHWDAC